ncbi:MAG: metallophosphoesterase family protein [Phycisphaerae bacterium]|nr:metallophosphoesterase family protein [Phycisphaerae bacterium]
MKRIRGNRWLTCAAVTSGMMGAALGQDRLAITHGPYLQQPTDTSMTVVWFTNRKCVSKVEYGTGEAIGSTAVSARHGLIDANTTRHAIRIAGLKPGTTYRYRVVSKEIVAFEAYKVTYGQTVIGDVHQFTTLDPAKGSFSFLTVNDIHNHDRQLRAMLEGASWEGVDLVFLNGDMINHFDSDEQIFSGFLDACVNVFAKNTPFFFVRGNHETRGVGARRLMDVFPGADGKFYTSFDHGGVHFIVLDSGEDKPDGDKEYSGLVAFDAYRAQQAAWLEADVRGEACREADFRIAVFHMPPYGGNNWHGETHLRKLWGPILNESGVDLVLCGHTHRFQRIDPAEDKNHYTLLIGGTDTVIRGQVGGKRLRVTVTRGPDSTTVDELSIAAKKD